MPASLKRIRENMKVQPTRENKGLTLTLTVVAYDNGIIEVDGIPMAKPETAWLGAAENVVMVLNEFQRQSLGRRLRGSPGVK